MTRKKEPSLSEDQNPPIRINDIPHKDHEAIKNISEDYLLSVTDFMKPHLRKIAESYPEEMRKPKPKDAPPNGEMKIRGVARSVHQMLQNIADNSGMSISDILKPHLPKIIEQYPEKTRRKKSKY